MRHDFGYQSRRQCRSYAPRTRSDHRRQRFPRELILILFLHAPFRDPDLLACILGADLPPLTPATLAGHAVRTDARGLRIALAPGPGEAPGALITASASAAARIDFAMAAMGAARTAVGGGRAAYLFAEAADRPWTAADWPVEGRARLSETLAEVMGHFGRRDAAEMPALLHGIAIRALGRARGPGRPAPVELGAGLGRADVEAVGREFSYARHFGMEEHRLRHRRFDGGLSDVIDRSVFSSGDAVTVLPFDPRAGTVLLIEQFRAGPHARGDPRPWCLEAVAGRCDALEPPEATARREALEEAGLTLGRLERIAAYYPSPGIISEFITAFVGEADLSAAGGLHGLPDEHEDIRAVVVPLDAALAAVASGEIDNAPLILSLLWLARHQDRLRREWG
jgi:nudix-type nucleoside diphosphatase (YffH/AdpP family)